MVVCSWTCDKEGQCDVSLSSRVCERKNADAHNRVAGRGARHNARLFRSKAHLQPRKLTELLRPRLTCSLI